MSDIYNIPVLITEDYLKQYSMLPENYDVTDIKPFISIAEAVHIIPIIGKPLYNELLEEVADNTVTDVNSTLLLEIYRVEAPCVVLEALPFIHSHLAEKGITQGKSDNSDSIDLETLSNLTNHLESEIGVLKNILQSFLNDHSDCYPLYTKPDCCDTDKPTRLFTNRVVHKPHNL